MAFVVVCLWFSPLKVKHTTADFDFNDDHIVDTANLFITHHPAAMSAEGPHVLNLGVVLGVAWLATQDDKVWRKCTNMCV